MWTVILPMVVLVLGEPVPASAPSGAPSVDRSADRTVTPVSFTIGTPRTAQARLAELLVEADSIESVHAEGRDVRFVIVDRDRMQQVTAHTGKRGIVTSLSVTTIARARGNELGALTWLGTELADTSAMSIVRLAVDEDGAVLVVTNDEREYLLIPGRGSGGSAARGSANDAAEARWAAAWNRDDADES